MAEKHWLDLKHDSPYHTIETGPEKVQYCFSPSITQQATSRPATPIIPPLFKTATYTRDTMLKCCSPTGIRFPCCTLASQFPKSPKITKCTMKHNRAKIHSSILAHGQLQNALHKYTQVSISPMPQATTALKRTPALKAPTSRSKDDHLRASSATGDFSVVRGTQIPYTHLPL